MWDMKDVEESNMTLCFWELSNWEDDGSIYLDKWTENGVGFSFSGESI